MHRYIKNNNNHILDLIEIKYKNENKMYDFIEEKWFYDLIEKYFPNINKLEKFVRKQLFLLSEKNYEYEYYSYETDLHLIDGFYNKLLYIVGSLYSLPYVYIPIEYGIINSDDYEKCIEIGNTYKSFISDNPLPLF